MAVIIHGDCLEELKKLEENSVDSITTDPPYELGFMGRGWDNTGIANNVEMWKECLRVLKPGGHLLSFGGTRTYHRMACAIEDAGFEVRDMIEWVYGSGFPKSLNIHKKDSRCPEGWGTALKPSHEPIVWASKPLTFNKVGNILRDIETNLTLSIWQSLNELQKEDMSKLQAMASIHLSIVLLWQNILEELLKKENKSTISTESKPIIELKILNSLLLKNTPEDMDGKSQTSQNGIQKSQVNGFSLLAEIVESYLGEEKKNTKDIQTLIAQGLVTWRKNAGGLNVKSVGIDLRTIILNANSVLLNVLTDLITEERKKELDTFVQFVKKDLQRLLAEDQSIVEESVWHEHLQKIRPNHSPIVLARKPLGEKTVAENCLKWGTGGINIDESRVESNEELGRNNNARTSGTSYVVQKETMRIDNSNGKRFPANLLHDNSEEVRECFPEAKTGAIKPYITTHEPEETAASFSRGMGKGNLRDFTQEASSGNASRFFKSIIYQAKSSKSERTANGTITNAHPTVKPIALMEYLIKMITPKGGIVLDPFAGSGSTLVAAKQSGFGYIGIEKEEEYVKIAEARLKSVPKTLFQQTDPTIK